MDDQDKNDNKARQTIKRPYFGKLILGIGLTNAFLTPIVGIYFGQDYLEEVRNRLVALVIYIAIVFFAWLIGIKLLQLDKPGPMPIWASPIVHLGPAFLVCLYFMFFTSWS